MSPEERQAELDNISAEDIKKIEQAQGKKVKVEIEDLLLAEFAMKFGWEAYKDARDDKITANEMMTLLTASRKLDNLRQYRDSQAAFIGSAAAKAKQPSSTFTKITSKLAKEAEADV
jgi:hypothetical protein